MYKVITDHGYQFYVPSNNQKILNYPLIDWCSQYLNPNSVFVDIGADLGYFSIILSQYCKSVYVIDPDFGFNITVDLNKIPNIILNDLNITNIGFLRIMHPIKNYHDLLKKNNYPPFIFDQQDHDYIKSLHYNIHPINGCSLFLASDNPAWQKITINILECDQFILSNAPLDQRQNALSKAFHAMTPLPYIKKINLNCPMGLRVPNNPSIIQINNNYLCNIRASNYVYDPHFRFLEDNIHLSDHHMITLDKDFKIIKTVILKDVTNNVYHNSFVKGIDDLRLINDHQFLCSHGNFNPCKIIDQCLGTFDGDGNVTSLIPLKGPNLLRHEKNWLPFYDEKLYFIYMIHPFILYRYENGLIKMKELKLTDQNLETFRGSAPPIPYKNGWLATAHQVTNMQYYHRFIWFDQDFTQIKYSIPFYFELQGIEFNLGMCHSPTGLLLTYSVWDNNAKLITIDYDVVDQYLLI